MTSAAPVAFERRLGVFSSSAILVGSMIGSGIFIAPAIMAAYVANAWALVGAVGGGRRTHAAWRRLVWRAGGHDAEGGRPVRLLA